MMANEDYSCSDEEDMRQKKKKKHAKKRKYTRYSSDERESSYRHRSRSPVRKIKTEKEWTPPRQSSSKHRGRREEDARERLQEHGRQIKQERVEVKRERGDRGRHLGSGAEQRRERQRNDDRRREHRRERGGNPFRESNQEYDFGHPGDRDNQNKNKPKEKEKPNFETSGKLAEDTNVYRGVVIKYNQPPEARKPKTRWRLYPFKGEDALPVLHIHRQSAYLIGRDRIVVDIPVDHPSCSKQHAVLQFRLVEYQRADGSTGRRVRPYIIDLGSSNGTYVNNNKVEPQRFVELIEKDVLKFGYSSREYVILHEKSDTSEVEDQGVLSD